MEIYPKKVRNPRNRFVFTLSARLRRDVFDLSQEWNCSESEVIRTALHRLVEQEKNR